MTPRPFIFDTEFDASGEVVTPSAWKPAKRTYLPAEVDALVAQARLEARQQALDEVENLRAMALNAVAQSVAQAMPALQSAAQAHREQSADLALAAARAIAGSALDRYPLAPLKAALEMLAQEIDASPRLVIRASGLDEAARETIADAIAAGGSSLRDYRQADGSLGYFQHAFAAYDREGQPCRHEGCAGTIARIVQSGRSTFFCPVCQR